MTRIKLPENLLSVLRYIDSKTELCDSCGRVIGTFIPPDDANWESADLPTNGELDRRRQIDRWVNEGGRA